MDQYYKNVIIYKDKSKSFLGFTFDTNEILKYFFGNNHNTKHENLKNLLENDEINIDRRDSLMDIFSCVQKTYWNISKFARIWRYKHANIYNKEDLYLNPIDESKKNVIVILQNKWKYLFPLKELMKSMNENLSNSPYSFPSPLSCKNPYTNIPLYKSQLYYIYFKIRESDYTIPILFYRFFLCNFDIAKFSNENDSLIKEIHVKNYTNNISKSNVIHIVNEMLKYHRIKRIHICSSFPKEILFNKMKNYISLYYESINNNNMRTRLELCMRLHVKLSYLIEYNPNFGRKRVNLVVNKDNPFKPKTKIITYNDDIPPFNSLSIHDFMSNHDEVYVNSITNDLLPTSNNFLPRLTRHYSINNVRVSRRNTIFRNRNNSSQLESLSDINTINNESDENDENDENDNVTVVIDDSDEEYTEMEREMDREIEEEIDQEIEEEINTFMNELRFNND